MERKDLELGSLKISTLGGEEGVKNKSSKGIFFSPCSGEKSMVSLMVSTS